MKRIAAGALLAASVAACSSGTVATDANGKPLTTGTTGSTSVRTITVVAAENFWGDIVEQIGGPHVRVTSLINDPNADPHTYETDPKDAAAISSARLAVVNGLGYDDFASRLLAASHNEARTVINVAQLNGVTGDDPNPHLWYDPGYVEKTAVGITAALGAQDPADVATFTANEQAFYTSYQPYVDEIAKIRSAYYGTRISYTERVPGYLVAAAGLVLGTPASFSQSVEDGDDPSPGDTAVFDADLTGRRVRVLLYNAQVTDQETDSIKSLAKKSGIPVVGVTETLPPGEKNFQTWQLDQATAIYRALGG